MVLAIILSLLVMLCQIQTMQAVGMASSNGGNGAIAINTSSHTPLLYSTTQCRFCNSNTNNGTLLDGGAIGAAFIR